MVNPPFLLAEKTGFSKPPKSRSFLMEKESLDALKENLVRKIKILMEKKRW